LLEKVLDCPFTLVSAPAGFGKTTLLAAWKQALPASKPLVAWVSLDEDDNEPRIFWTYALTALQMQRPEAFAPLVTQLQSPQTPPLQYILAELINSLLESTDEFVLILDDYQLITEQQVHKTLAYLIEHLPPQLHIILATRADPPLPLPLLRAQQHALEVRADQLRCTLAETKAFLQEVMSLQLPDEVIREIRDRTEGWLVGLQLLGLSLPELVDPLALLEEVSGDQRYILDYLTQEVLQRQSQEVQTFLLGTSILDQLSASLCDAVMDQTGSQQMLQRLEQTNLFIVSLDSKRQWYRYHALFAQALRYRLEQTRADLIPSLHHRASLWYAQHNQTSEAILHAVRACEWQWAADLIEQKSLQFLAHTWGLSGRQLHMLQHWLGQLPADIVHSRPRLCLTCVQVLWVVAPPPMLEGWLEAAETTLTTLLLTQTHEDTSRALPPQAPQSPQHVLGQVMTWRAFLRSFYEQDGQAVLALCQRALALLSADDSVTRVYVALTQLLTYYVSSLNDAWASIENGLQTISLAQQAGLTSFALDKATAAAMHMIGPGRLYEVQQLYRQVRQMGEQPGEQVLPEVGWSAVYHAEILREWNQLDTALSVIEEALLLCKQIESMASLPYLITGHAILLRIFLSRGELDAARSAFQQIEHIGTNMNQPTRIYLCALFTTIDQVRLWLACGELDRATRWAEALDLVEHHITPFAREREEVACARVYLATNQPDLALQRLGPALQRATAGKRWGHVIEIRLLQALTYQLCQEETQALDALSQAIRLGEPEGYIRSFVDEGAPMEALLSQLRERDHENGPTPYLDKLLAVFQQERKPHRAAGEPAKASQTPGPLSQRELEVLQLLAQGRSNREIARELMIAIDTVKRHINHIFSKLGVQNRVQAVKQAQELGLLSEEL
jgi:LuxR family maltose regulon positive regulatory protein